MQAACYWAKPGAVLNRLKTLSSELEGEEETVTPWAMWPLPGQEAVHMWKVQIKNLCSQTIWTVLLKFVHIFFHCNVILQLFVMIMNNLIMLKVPGLAWVCACVCENCLIFRLFYLMMVPWTAFWCSTPNTEYMSLNPYQSFTMSLFPFYLSPVKCHSVQSMEATSW